MAKDVIMPALGMSQETGTLLQWFKAPGDAVAKGEPLMEIETDKAAVEIEAPASGVLASITAQPGDVVPVGQRIAVILAPGEPEPGKAQTRAAEAETSTPGPSTGTPPMSPTPGAEPGPAPDAAPVTASPIARRMAAEHHLDLAQIKPGGGLVQKEDVLAYLASQQNSKGLHLNRRVLASPKARRLAQERGVDLRSIPGSGPEGAVLTADILSSPPSLDAGVAELLPSPSGRGPVQTTGDGDEGELLAGRESQSFTVSRLWQRMAERVTQAWTTVPQFYLMRETNASRLVAWREEVQKRSLQKITFTDLFVKLTAAALRAHPQLNASWQNGTILFNPEINLGLAVAVDEGLVVPVIHRADELGLGQLAARRVELTTKAQAGKLSPDDLSGGTFTISNLGMYGVDAFNAIVNPPQAAILAVSRIADRVVPLQGQPAVQPMVILSLTCDHRVVDGARGAQFLQALAELIEDPLRLFD